MTQNITIDDLRAVTVIGGERVESNGRFEVVVDDERTSLTVTRRAHQDRPEQSIAVSHLELAIILLSELERLRSERVGTDRIPSGFEHRIAKRPRGWGFEIERINVAVFTDRSARDYVLTERGVPVFAFERATYAEMDGVQPDPIIGTDEERPFWDALLRQLGAEQFLAQRNGRARKVSA